MKYGVRLFMLVSYLQILCSTFSPSTSYNQDAFSLYIKKYNNMAFFIPSSVFVRRPGRFGNPGEFGWYRLCIGKKGSMELSVSFTDLKWTADGSAVCQKRKLLAVRDIESGCSWIWSGVLRRWGIHLSSGMMAAMRGLHVAYNSREVILGRWLCRQHV